MKKKIDWWLDLFEKMTKEESDYIYNILMMDDEKKIAFIIAKRIFEDKDELQE